MAADIHHAQYPIGPVGVPTESHLFFNQMIMKYTKYPQAAKEFLRFMMEAEQFDDWLNGGGGYIAHAAGAPTRRPDLDLRPEAHAVPRLREEPAARRATPASWAMRRPARWRDFIVANMVAEAASGSKTSEGGGRAGAEARRALLQGIAATSRRYTSARSSGVGLRPIRSTRRL